MPLCYNLCRSLWPPKFYMISIWFLLSTPKYLPFYANINFYPHCAGNLLGWFLLGRLRYVANKGVRTMRRRRWGGRGHVGGEMFCASFCAKLFWCAIYCAKPRTDPKYQSSSCCCKGLGSQALLIMREYDLTTVITIWLLTHPRTLKMGSLSFSAMSWLKFESMPRASFPIMQSTDSKNG